MADISNNNIIVTQQQAELSNLVIASLIALLPTVSTGTALAFSTTAAVQYKTANATSLDEPLNEDQASWFVSCMAMAVMVGTLCSGPLADRFGRKISTLISQLIMLGGWAILYWAPSFSVLMGGRLICGFGAGITIPSSYMILSEIALVRIRGTLTVTNTLISNASFIYSLLLASFLSTKFVIIMSCLPPVLFILLFYFLPESPLWLVKQGRVQEAEKVLAWLRGQHYPLMVEIKEIEHVLTEQQCGLVTVKDKVKYMTSRSVIRPVVMMLGMFMLQPLSGGETVAYYSLDIFKRANVKMNNYVLSVLVQGGFTLGYVFSTPMLSRVPRRVQFIASGIFMAMSLSALGFILQAEMSGDTEWKSICEAMLPICVIGSGLAYGMGVGPVLFALVGEVLPPRVKGLCCSLVLAARNSMSFINLKVFPTVVHAVGLPAVFWIHSTIICVTCVIAFFVVPETQGKTMTELANMYVKPPKKASTKAEEANMA